MWSTACRVLAQLKDQMTTTIPNRSAASGKPHKFTSYLASKAINNVKRKLKQVRQLSGLAYIPTCRSPSEARLWPWPLTSQGHPKWSPWVHILILAVLYIFHVKKYELDFWPLKVIQGQIWRCQSKAHGYFQKSPPWVQPRICHRFRDISSQKIVTLTFWLEGG